MTHLKAKIMKNERLGIDRKRKFKKEKGNSKKGKGEYLKKYKCQALESRKEERV